MKKRISLILVFLLLINIVSSGETFQLDFTENPAYVVGLSNGDRIEFKLKDSLHTVLIKKITKESVDIAIFTNIEDADNSLKVPIYTRINTKKFVKLDIEKDGNTDLNIIYKVSNNTAASVLFQLPLGPDKDLVVFPESQFKKDNFLQMLLYLFVALIVLFGLLYLFLRKQAKETEEVFEEKQQETQPKNKAE